jgi:hypothetical protein
MREREQTRRPCRPIVAGIWGGSLTSALGSGTSMARTTTLRTAAGRAVTTDDRETVAEALLVARMVICIVAACGGN